MIAPSPGSMKVDVRRPHDADVVAWNVVLATGSLRDLAGLLAADDVCSFRGQDVAQVEVTDPATTLQARRALSTLSQKATHRVESYSIRLNRVDPAEVISECTIDLDRPAEVHFRVPETWHRKSGTWKLVRGQLKSAEAMYQLRSVVGPGEDVAPGQS
jgi:hypothetical protein